ncbi:MAG: MotA/TolQ/ExbB proton channel family protein [Phycisphaerae bacterium]|nr:MotA/TolQ/ExbB proton channel family protein [Phycisphaerae bacterium]
MTDSIATTLADSSAFLLAQAADQATAWMPRTILEYVQSGGKLSYVLVALSVVALALMLRNAVALRPTRIAPPYVNDNLTRFARAGDAAGALEFCRKDENDCLLANAVGAGLERTGDSAFQSFEVRQEIEAAGRQEVDRLHRLNDGLGIIAAVAPMLGLLGTVIGMIGAFGAIGGLQGAARSSELARFMSLALVCTAEGLAVAIPCTIAFAIFRRRIDRLAADAAQDADAIARLFTAAWSGASARAPATAKAASKPAGAGA